MKRRLLNLAAALSLLLCIVTAVLWVRSYRVADTVRRYSEHDSGEVELKHRSITWYARSAAGELMLLFATDLVDRNAGPKREAGWTWNADEADRPSQPPYPRGLSYDRGRVLAAFAGFELVVKINDVGRIRSAWRQRWVRIPYWMPVALLLPLPLWRGAGIVRRTTRSAAGRCANCGYDLRATPDRCPECGLVPGGAREAAA